MNKILLLILLTPIAFACTNFDSTTTAGDTIFQFGFDTCYHDTATNLTYQGLARKNEIIQFQYPDYGITGRLGYYWPEANLTINNTQSLNTLITLNPGQYNDSYYQKTGINTTCNNITYLQCPQANQAYQVNYSGHYYNDTYKLNVTCPAYPTCNAIQTNCTPTRLNIDKKMKVGDIESNTELGYRYECDGELTTLLKQIPLGDTLAINDTCFKNLEIICGETINKTISNQTYEQGYTLGYQQGITSQNCPVCETPKPDSTYEYLSAILLFVIISEYVYLTNKTPNSIQEAE